MKSIWAKNMSHEKNVHVAYLYTLKPNADALCGSPKGF